MKSHTTCVKPFGLLLIHASPTTHAVSVHAFPSSQGAADYFASHGVPCPPNKAVAEHMLSVANVPSMLAQLLASLSQAPSPPQSPDSYPDSNTTTNTNTSPHHLRRDGSEISTDMPNGNNRISGSSGSLANFSAGLSGQGVQMAAVHAAVLAPLSSVQRCVQGSPVRVEGWELLACWRLGTLTRMCRKGLRGWVGRGRERERWVVWFGPDGVCFMRWLS